MKFKLINNKYLYFTLAFFAFLVAMYGLTFRQFSYFWFKPFTWIYHQVPARIHFITGPVVLLLGIFQFSLTIRRKWPSIHRWIGRTYILSLLISAGSVFAIFRFAAYGLLVQISLVVLNVVWLITLFISIYFIAVKKDIINHKYWMTRNYALTCSAITLRIIFGSLWQITGDQEIAYQIATSSCYFINLLIGEIIIYQYKQQEKRNSISLLEQNEELEEDSQNTKEQRIVNKGLHINEQ